MEHYIRHPPAISIPKTNSGTRFRKNSNYFNTCVIAQNACAHLTSARAQVGHQALTLTCRSAVRRKLMLAMPLAVQVATHYQCTTPSAA
jgi:hypothetical protein